MLEDFREQYNFDLEKMAKEFRKNRTEKEKIEVEKQSKIYDCFWRQLNEKQQNLFRYIETFLFDEDDEINYLTYLHAYKKGIALGYETARAEFGKGKTV